MAEPIDISGDQMIDTSQDEFLPADVKPDYVKRAQEDLSQQNQSRLQNNPGWVTQADKSGLDSTQNIRAAAQRATSGLAPRLMDEFQAAKSDPMNYLRDTLKPEGVDTVQRVPVGTQYRDMYQKAAQRSPAAAVAGSVMNPLNQVGGGVGALFVGGAAMEGIQQGMGTKQIDPANVATSGAINAAFPQVMKAGGNVLDWAAKKMTPPALNFVKDMALKVLQSRSSMTGQAMQEFTRQGSSKMGFNTFLDDILYTVIDKIDPKFFQREATRTGNIQGLVKAAGDEVGTAAVKIDAATPRAGNVGSQLDALADQTARSTDPRITSGVPASKVIRQEFAQQPLNANPDAPYPLGQLRKKITEVNNTQYQKAALPQIPEKGVQQATGQVKDWLVKKAGMTPDEILAFKTADEGFERAKKTSDIYFDSAAKPEPNVMPKNTLGGIVSQNLLRPIKAKATQAAYSTGKAAAQAAMNRLEKRFGTGPFTNMSVLQADTIRSKLATIAGMEPADSAAYVYAQSMVNPLFRAVWNQRDSDDGDQK